MLTLFVVVFIVPTMVNTRPSTIVAVFNTIAALETIVPLKIELLFMVAAPLINQKIFFD